MRAALDFWQRLQQRTLTRVGKNALALLAMQGGIRLFSLLLAAQCIRSLGTAGLGRYLLATTVEAIALVVVDLGLNTYTVREMARERPAGEQESLWGTLLGLKLLAGLGGVALLNGLVAPLLFPGERRVLVGLVSLALLPDALNSLAAAVVQARQRMEISSAITLGVRFLAILGGLLLLWAGRDERAVLLAYFLASLSGTLAFFLLLRSWGLRPDWLALPRRWRGVLSEAVPFAVTSMAAMLYMRMDLLMLSYWQGDAAAGLYGAAYRLWEALGIVPTSMLDALFPEMSRQSGHLGGRAQLYRLYRRGQRVLLAGTVLLLLAALVLAPYLMPLLYDQSSETATATLLFRGLVLVLPFTYLYLLNGHALYALGQQRRVTVAIVVVTVFKGLFNALLIPTWSYWGAVGVAWFTEVVLFFLLFLSARAAFRSPLPGEDHIGGG